MKTLEWEDCPTLTKWGEGMQQCIFGIGADATFSIICHIDDIKKFEQRLGYIPNTYILNKNMENEGILGCAYKQDDGDSTKVLFLD